MVYDTPVPNKRKEGVSRISVTLPDEMLLELEQEAAQRASVDPGFDRLCFIREAISEKLAVLKSPKEPPEPKTPGRKRAGSKRKN